MGQINKGILGPFSGKVGTVIGGTWKGIAYMRSRPQRGKGTSTQKQLEQQLKFKIVVMFFQTMSGLLNISFRSFTAKMTGFNSAVSYGLQNGISGAYPAYDINYPQMLVARGDLPNASDAAAAATGNGEITFSWTNNAGTGKAANTDKAILVVYCAFYNQCIYKSGSAPRSAETEVLNVSVFTGQAVETWFSFTDEAGRDSATSIYTGHLTIT